MAQARQGANGELTFGARKSGDTLHWGTNNPRSWRTGMTAGGRASSMALGGGMKSAEADAVSGLAANATGPVPRNALLYTTLALGTDRILTVRDGVTKQSSVRSDDEVRLWLGDGKPRTGISFAVGIAPKPLWPSICATRREGARYPQWVPLRCVT